MTREMSLTGYSKGFVLPLSLRCTSITIPLSLGFTAFLATFCWIADTFEFCLSHGLSEAGFSPSDEPFKICWSIGVRSSHSRCSHAYQNSFFKPFPKPSDMRFGHGNGWFSAMSDWTIIGMNQNIKIRPEPELAGTQKKYPARTETKRFDKYWNI